MKQTTDNDLIFLDNAATTRVDDLVVDAMLPCFSACYGNPSSLHRAGVTARQLLDSARESIARSIGAKPQEIYFTSGGTEANNWALKGIAFSHFGAGNEILTSSIEHDCILNACKWLTHLGFNHQMLEVDAYGLLNTITLANAISNKTILVSVMTANNEIGTVQPIKKLADECHARGVLFHTDACQAFGKIKIDVKESGVDMLTFNAHKIYGPKGVGALYIREGVSIEPLLHGGGQESGLRSTTENLPGIVGFATAVDLFRKNLPETIYQIRQLSDYLTAKLEESFPTIQFYGHPVERLPGHLSFGFGGYEGDAIRLLLLLDDEGLMVSAGSACSSNHSGNASHVLQAIGLNQLEARGAIRVSLGRNNTQSHCDALINSLKDSLPQMRTWMH